MLFMIMSETEQSPRNSYCSFGLTFVIHQITTTEQLPTYSFPIVRDSGNVKSGTVWNATNTVCLYVSTSPATRSISSENVVNFIRFSGIYIFAISIS